MRRGGGGPFKGPDMATAHTPHTHTYTQTCRSLTGMNGSGAHTLVLLIEPSAPVIRCRTLMLRSHVRRRGIQPTHTHAHTSIISPLLLPLHLSVSLWLSLSLCMFSVSKLETVSSAKRDTKAIVLIQDSKPLRGFRGLTHTHVHSHTRTRAHAVMRFRAC